MWSLTPPRGTGVLQPTTRPGLCWDPLLSGAGICRGRVPRTRAWHTVVQGAEASRWWRKSREFFRRRYAHRASEHALGPEPCPLAVRVARQRQRKLRVGLEGSPGLSSRCVEVPGMSLQAAQAQRHVLRPPQSRTEHAVWATADGSLLCICGRRPGARPPAAPAAGGAPSLGFLVRRGTAAASEFQGDSKDGPQGASWVPRALS